jgi:hypothetical protein
VAAPDTTTRRPLRSGAYDDTLDLDTNQYGTVGPFEPWEHDHTALVHVLWHLQRSRLTLTEPDLSDVADRIMRSRWFAAALADGTVYSADSLLRYNPDVDPDTRESGHAAPWQRWEGEKPALVRVLRYAARQGLTLDAGRSADSLASMIGRSRWLAAARATARASSST